MKTRRRATTAALVSLMLLLILCLLWWRSESAVDQVIIPLGTHVLRFGSAYGELWAEYFKLDPDYHGPWVLSLPADPLTRAIYAVGRSRFFLGLDVSHSSDLAITVVDWWPACLLLVAATLLFRRSHRTPINNAPVGFPLAHPTTTLTADPSASESSGGTHLPESAPTPPSPRPSIHLTSDEPPGS
jgi:hypothetical protein